MYEKKDLIAFFITELIDGIDDDLLFYVLDLTNSD